MASGRLVDYLGQGDIADRPVSLNLSTGALGLWYATDTGVLSAWDGTVWADISSGGSGGVQSVVAGTGISVDNTDPDNPIVTATTTAVLESVVAGTNVTVDNTDPANPIINATGGGGGGNLYTPVYALGSAYAYTFCDQPVTLTVYNNVALTANGMRGRLVRIPQDMNINGVIRLRNAGTSTDRIAFALYDLNADNLPGNLVYDFGEISGLTTVGLKTTGNLDVVAGYYWLISNGNAASSLAATASTTIDGYGPISIANTSGTTASPNINRISATVPYAYPLPSDLTSTSFTLDSNGNFYVFFSVNSLA